MKTAVIIPARMGSMRFPGKVLADLGGKPVIQHVWENAMQSKADLVMVAADDVRVEQAVKAFGGQVVMTKPSHPSGSDRVWEAAQSTDAELIVNVQGDEPFLPSQVIDDLIDAMHGPDAPAMGTVVLPCPRADIASNPNLPKVVLTADDYAIYFSRSMIPYLREGGEETAVYRHWGIYAYRRETLAKFVSLPEGRLEKCEKLEQLRALENGIRIKVIRTSFDSIGIDTPEDLVRAQEFLARRQKTI
ncbi:MAG: 3-deoxy-manno-octulosonate cytidylyltransferase [Lentisphaeria bacterium]|nr:3-deoxy-manno-octulosonate cytidylyltransferase [Lentisphaeria bacterium]